MRALVKYASGPGNVELREVPEPSCGPHQVKLEVAWCGLCGTDLHVRNDTFRNFPPVILGHEFAGVAIEVGARVEGISLGERFCVLGASTVTCGRCVYCRQGEFMFCRERRGMGHGVNGAFARYVVARPDQLFRLPANVSLEEGAACEPFAAAVHAVCEITPIQLGDVALVSGPGPIGWLCLKLLLAQGARTMVAGAGADRARLEWARQAGAHRVVNLAEESLEAAVMSESDGLGVDLAFECAGAASSVNNCLFALRPLGRYTQVGHFGKETTVGLDPIAFKQLRVAGSVGYTAATWTKMLRILEQGKVKLGDFITHRLPLERWQEGFAACEDKSALKVLLKP